MPELKFSNEELQSLLVKELGVIDQADFNRAAHSPNGSELLSFIRWSSKAASHKYSCWTNLPAVGVSDSSTWHSVT